MEGSHSASSADPPMRRKRPFVKMYYFYVLRFGKSKKLYYGYTDDLKRRIHEHKIGDSDFTSRNGDFDLIFYEAYPDKRDAREAERYFKSGHGREVLKAKLKNYFGGFA
jgi:putative endonuclease